MGRSGTIADRGVRRNKTVEEGLFAFIIRTFEEVPLWRREDRFQKLPAIADAVARHLIMQAANTGLTGGSTPDGSDYDRDIVT